MKKDFNDKLLALRDRKIASINEVRKIIVK